MAKDRDWGKDAKLLRIQDSVTRERGRCRKVRRPNHRWGQGEGQ